jgi:hypothetical protein
VELFQFALAFNLVWWLILRYKYPNLGIASIS